MVRQLHATRFFGGGHEDICCVLLMFLGACLLRQYYSPPRFRTMSDQNTCVTWLGNMNGSSI